MGKGEGGECDSSDCRDVRAGDGATVCDMLNRGLVFWTHDHSQLATAETWRSPVGVKNGRVTGFQGLRVHRFCATLGLYCTRKGSV